MFFNYNHFACSLDIEESVIEANQQRSKSNENKAREFLHLKQIETQRAEKRRLATQNNNSAKAVPVNLPDQVKGDSRDIAAAKIGLSGRTAEQAAEVVNVIDAMEDIGDDKKADELKEKQRLNSN